MLRGFLFYREARAYGAPADGGGQVRSFVRNGKNLSVNAPGLPIRYSVCRGRRGFRLVFGPQPGIRPATVGNCMLRWGRLQLMRLSDLQSGGGVFLRVSIKKWSGLSLAQRAAPQIPGCNIPCRGGLLASAKLETSSAPHPAYENNCCCCPAGGRFPGPTPGQPIPAPTSSANPHLPAALTQTKPKRETVHES